jgi:hypothetical protein
MTTELKRLDEAREGTAAWKKWGPYLSERQWGTVREDYSTDGNAWAFFSHDQARSRAYKWGEDGLAGISDEDQNLCFALALWNGNDPILKERLFGLTNSEGNHGEDVKEYYFYLDSTPTHSYMKYLYKYPQAAYPYDQIVATNKGRSREEMEYELLDTGVFDDDRYYDVFVEYAKASPEDLLIAVTIANRGPEAATLHVLPTLWFRNQWSWGSNLPRPELRQAEGPAGSRAVRAEHQKLGTRYFYCEGDPELLFTENETNEERIHGKPNAGPYVKDAFHRYVVHGETGAVNPEKRGTKVAPHYVVTVGAGATTTLRLRLTDAASPATAGAGSKGSPFDGFDAILRERQGEADAFYEGITPDTLSADEALVMRQALSGMLWTKQFYYYDLDRWLEEAGGHPFIRGSRPNVRNNQWHHMFNADVISMPDKWEYPWYAAWDLAFHTTALALVDPDFAKHQLDLFLNERYLHPSGQIPAYEWNFGDVNPPVHAWATLFVYRLDEEINGKPDPIFLEKSFQKLLLNFTWWVNRKDRNGRNLYEGGFLGLDNIGVFDRSSPLPTGGYLEQADGTAWMAFYCQNMLEIALELLPHDPATYGAMATRFFRHFLFIASAMDRLGEHADELWDEEDGFYYDVLCLPDGSAMRLKVRSMVGLLSLAATTVIAPEQLALMPDLPANVKLFLERSPELTANIAVPNKPGYEGRYLLSALNEPKLRRVLAYLLDENEFLSPYGIRALSRYHEANPFIFHVNGQEYRVNYLPAESDNGMFGGNSNWRGPIWMPVNLLLWRALVQLYTYYGDDFKVECPTGSGQFVTLFQAAQEIAGRLSAIFLRNAEGKRPVFGGSEKFQNDPHWRDHLLFYEYFHADNGAGLGASHQTGWTGTIARLIQFYGHVTKSELLKEGWQQNLAYTDEMEQPG